MKVPGRVTSPGRAPGKDARESPKLRPILIVLVLFALISAAVWAALSFASSTTRKEVQRFVQTQCKLASTSFAGDVSIAGESLVGSAEVPYVDSTGSHIAIVRIGEDGAYSLDTCGR